jgi:hypothetical protein
MLTTAIGLGMGATAFAQDAASTDTQRDVNQQDRIEQGLQSGQLSTGEAARLEQGEARIDRIESNADRNGTVSPAEQTRIDNAQNRESNAIYDDKHNAVTGNPESASSQRMQADVQRDADQQSRIEQGINSGSLNNSQVSRLESGQAHDSRIQARAGANGNVSAREQRRAQLAENRQSRHIYHAKHPTP